MKIQESGLAIQSSDFSGQVGGDSAQGIHGSPRLAQRTVACCDLGQRTLSCSRHPTVALMLRSNVTCVLPLTSLDCSLAAWPRVYTAVFLGKYFCLRATKQKASPYCLCLVYILIRPRRKVSLLPSHSKTSSLPARLC